MFKYIVALGILLASAAGASHCDHGKDHAKPHGHGGQIAAPATR